MWKNNYITEANNYIIKSNFDIRITKIVSRFPCFLPFSLFLSSFFFSFHLSHPALPSTGFLVFDLCATTAPQSSFTKNTLANMEHKKLYGWWMVEGKRKGVVMSLFQNHSNYEHNELSRIINHRKGVEERREKSRH